MQPTNSVLQGILLANPELSKDSSPDNKAEIKFKSYDVQVYSRNDSANFMVAGGEGESSSSIIDPIEEASHFSVSDISNDMSSQEDFNQLLDQFLDIPHSDYILIEESILEKYNSSISNAYKRGIIGDFYKIRALLIKIIIQWQKEEHSKEAKEVIKNNILELQVLAIKKKQDLSNCFKNWLLLHTFKSVVTGERLPESDKAKILQAISNPIFPEIDSTYESVKKMKFEYMDLVSFQLLLFFDALPNFRDYANYEKGFQLLKIFEYIADNHLFLISPVSFTPYDHIRFLSLNDSLLQIVFDNLHSVNQTGACCQLIAIGLLCGDIIDKMKTLSFPQFYFKPYMDLRLDLGLFFSGMGKITDEKKMRSNKIDLLNELIMKRLDTILKQKNMDENDKTLYGLYSYMQANVIVGFNTRKCKKSRHEFAKAARIFSDAAQYRPNNFYNSWYYYQKARLFRPASQAAQAYSNFWSGKKYRILAEYWTDISIQMDMLASPAKDESKGITGHEYDIDKILNELEAKCDVQPERETSQILPSNSGGSGYSMSSHRDKVETVSDIPSESEEDSEADVCPVTLATSDVARPVIRSSERSNNVADISMAIQEGFLIKGAKGVIKPWEKLLSKNWNYAIKKILKSIDHARINSNIDEEKRIYRKILNHPLRKTMIGIERIWEEYAWSELHQFDDVFRTCILPSSMRDTAKKLVSKVKDGYILPCMARFLGLDQINFNLSLDEIFRGATRLVESTELSDPDDNREVRSRLCYLFRTWGHLYGLMALIYLDRSVHFEKLAVKAYDFSSIDPTYAKRKMARLKQGYSS